jgi:hypothetical protein
MESDMSRVAPALTVLRWIANLHVIGGLCLALLLWIPSLHPLLLKLIYGNTPITNPQQTIFWICVLGPTVASWGVLCRICVDYFAEQPNKRTYHRLILALLVWAPLDTTMCISQGIYLAAFLNVSVVILFWYLCHRIWKQELNWNK